MPVDFDEILKAKPGRTPFSDVLAADIDVDDQSFVASAIETAKREVAVTGSNLAAGALGSAASLDNTTANLFMVLDRGAQLLQEKTGLSRGGAFRRAEEFFREEARGLFESARKRAGTGLPSQVTQMIGGLPLGLAQAGAAAITAGPVAGFAALGALSEADRGPLETAIAAVQGAALGGIFKITSGAPRLTRGVTVGTGAAALEEARGNSGSSSVLSSTTVGTLAALTGRPTRVRLPGPGQFEPPAKPRFRAKLDPETGETTLRELVPTHVGKTAVDLEPIVEVTANVAPRPGVKVTPDTVAKANEFLGRDYSDINIPDKTINLNLNRIKGPEDFKRALTALTDVYRAEIDHARRGTISREQTVKMADDLGMTVERMMRDRRGQAFNAEEIVARRQLNRSVLEEWHRLATRIQSGKGSDIDKVEFLRATALSEATLKDTLGGTAEAGRALSSFNTRIGPSTRQMKDLREIIDQFQSSGKLKRGQFLEDFAGQVAQINTPGGLAKFAEAYRKATVGEKLFELWINNLLSGPQTHAVNILSNSLVAAWTIPETYVAASIGALRAGKSKLLGGRNLTRDRVFFGEGTAAIHGLVEASREGLQLAGRALKTGEPVGVGTKLELPRFKSIGGLPGDVIRWPTRLLMAEDAFFQVVGFRMELKRQALRKAILEGHKGSALAQRVRNIERDPSGELLDVSIENARIQTFTNQLGVAMQGFQKFTLIHPMFKMFFPFIRTPTNIFKFSTKRTPLGLAFREVRADIRKGGAAKDLALGRMAFGTGVMAWMASEAAKDDVTGSGPADPELRAAWLTQHQPFSFRIPDFVNDIAQGSAEPNGPLSQSPDGTWWLSYGRLEPLGTLIGVAADFQTISGQIEEDTAEEIGAALVMSFTRNVSNKTFLQGAGTLAQATADPKRGLPQLINNIASSFVPAFVRQGTRTIADPVLRDARDAVSSIMRGIPGMSETLPARRNIWGEPILLQGGLGPDFISPVYSRRTEPDFTSSEVIRLKAKLGAPKRTLGGIDLTPEEFSELSRIVGQQAKQLIDGFTASPLYHGIPDPAKREIMEDIYSEARAFGRVQLLSRINRDDPLRVREGLLKGTLTGELIELRSP